MSNKPTHKMGKRLKQILYKERYKNWQKIKKNKKVDIIYHQGNLS